MKISKDDVIQSILVLLREEFEGELTVSEDKILVNFFNGQKFEITAKEVTSEPVPDVVGIATILAFLPIFGNFMVRFLISRKRR